jgi:3',5'-cyclic AMP phosphodiesterase CpdA
MTYKFQRIVSVLCLVSALCAAALLPASGYCENLRFVFLADSRSETRPTDPSNLDLAINTPVLNAIIAQIQLLSPPPAFVVFGGDMAYRGCFTFSKTPYYIFQTFKDLFAPLTSAGIPLYTAIGNHELYDEHTLGFLFANQTEYRLVFPNIPSNPLPGYEGLVYSFPSPGGDAFFAVLDPYYLTANNPTPDLGGTITPDQLTWLAAQVAQSKATHKFLFIHVPYYFVFNDPDEPTGDHDATWTQLWSVLDNNSFKLFCCGHTHLYSRKAIDSSIDPNPPLPPLQWRNNVVQLLCGTCGAGPSTGTPTVNPILWNISNPPDTYYFSVVDIKGPEVVVKSYKGNTGDYTIFDSFALHSAVSAVDSLLLD